MQIPQQIGPYRVLHPLGEGGMGTVLEAVRDDIELRVAIKILKPELASDEKISRRFLNEARAVIQANNPGIVQVFDYGHLPWGAPYIVMELLSGQTLAARLREAGGRMPAEEYLRIVLEMARTLGATHARSVIHRDLKPDNVMLVRAPDAADGFLVKLLDFGIAKMVADIRGGQTSVCMLMGTPEYMSPEQCRGARDIDARTDVYSLGVILFQLASGRRPFPGPSPGELIGQHQYQPPPSLTELAPWAPAGLAQLVDRMLQKEPTLRPTIKMVSEELQLLIGSLYSSPAPSHSGPASKTIPFHLVDALPSRETLRLSAQALPSSLQRSRPLRPWVRRRALLVAVGITVTTGVAIWLKSSDVSGPGIQSQAHSHAGGLRITPVAQVSNREPIMTGIGTQAAGQDMSSPQDLSLRSNSTSVAASPISASRSGKGALSKPSSSRGHTEKRAPAPNPLLAEAQNALIHGQYQTVIDVVMQIEPTSRDSSLAWSLIGQAACHQKNLEIAKLANQKLEGKDRVLSVAACNSERITFSTEGLAEEEKRRTDFKIARSDVLNNFAKSRFVPAIDGATLQISRMTDSAEQAELRHIVKMSSACHLKNKRSLEEAVEGLSKSPQLLEELASRASSSSWCKQNLKMFNQEEKNKHSQLNAASRVLNETAR